jgi:hypothetical protein
MKILEERDGVYASVPSLTSKPPARRHSEMAFLDDLLNIALQLVFGYLFPTPDPTQQLQDTLTQVNDKLNEIAASLTQVQQGINAILNRLDQLAAEIKGYITLESYSSHLESCRSFVEWVQPKVTTPAEFAPNKEAMRLKLGDFQDNINQVLRTTQDESGQDGVAGLLSVAQFMGSWAQVQNLLLRADGSPQRVQDQAFHRDKFDRFNKIFDRIEQAKVDMPHELFGIPHEDSFDPSIGIYLLRNGQFFAPLGGPNPGILEMSFKEKDYGTEPQLLGSYFKTGIPNAELLYGLISDVSLPWLPLWGPVLDEARALWPSKAKRLKEIRASEVYCARSIEARAQLHAVDTP